MADNDDLSQSTNDPPQDPPDTFTLRDEANALVVCAFRNGPLEQLHRGEWSPLLDDPSLRRITGPEMKDLMLNACRTLHRLLQLKESNPEEYYAVVKKFNKDYCEKWER